MTAFIVLGLLATNAALPDGPRVYAHVCPWFPPDHSRPDHAVDLAGGLEGAVRAAWAAGVDGFTVDLVLRPPSRTASILAAWLKAADAADGFTVGPCLDQAASHDPDEWLELLRAWFELSRGNPHRMSLAGRPVVFTYAAYGMTAEQWARLREGCRAAGEDPVLVADAEGVLRPQGEQALPLLQGLAGVFEGLYCFAPQADGQALLDQAQRAPGPSGLRLRTFAPSPGYWRHTNGAFSRLYRGTATYRETWQQARELGVDAVALCTWNDYAEHTHLEPSRNASDLLCRLTRVEAARFKGRDANAAAGDETYWLTLPAEMPDGTGFGPLEANLRRERIFAATRIGPVAAGATRSVEVSLELPDGTPVAARTLGLAADEVVAETAFEWEPERTLGVRFLRVRARCGQATASAPILLWPRDVSHRFYMAPLRVKLTADVAAPPVVEARDDRLSVTPLPDAEPWRVDVVHDLYEQRDPRSTTGRVGVGTDQLPPPPLAWGYWTAARVSPQAVTIWADPVWLAPHGDPLLLALWRFEDGAEDDSVYARHGRVVAAPNTAWQAELADGGHALHSGADAWVEPPGGFCPAAGPVTVELWARPEVPGGMLWGDVPAPLLLSLQGLVPQVGRHTDEPAKWTWVTAPKPLATGLWSHVAGVWDGRDLVLYVDGVEVGRQACPGPSGSQRMGIGRNPFNAGSPFTGLIDDVRMTAQALAPADFGPVHPLQARPAEPKP